MKCGQVLNQSVDQSVNQSISWSDQIVRHMNNSDVEMEMGVTHTFVLFASSDGTQQVNSNPLVFW